MKMRHIICLFFLMPIYLFAQNWNLEVGAAHYNAPKILKDHFSGGWIDCQIEASYLMDDCVELWVGTNWIAKKHKTDEEDSSYSFCSSEIEKNQIWILPISAGAKYFFYVTPCASIYLGAGVVCTFMTVTHENYYSKDSFSKNGIGAVIKSGIRYDWGDYTFVNIFCDYYHQVFQLSHSDMQLGYNRTFDLSGYKAGFSFGVYF